MKETTYCAVKPWFANKEEVISEVKRRILSAGLEIEEEEYVKYGKEQARKHYAAHVSKDFYPHLEEYITSDKVYGMIITGENAITKVRELVGATKNPEAGTIRHDIPTMLNIPIRVTENVVHASDSQEAAESEIAIFKDLVKAIKAEVCDKE